MEKSFLIKVRPMVHFEKTLIQKILSFGWKPIIKFKEGLSNVVKNIKNEFIEVIEIIGIFLIIYFTVKKFKFLVDDITYSDHKKLGKYNSNQ